MKERPLKKPGDDTRKLTPWKRRKLWWGIACVAVSILPLILEIIYLCLTKQDFKFIIARPSIPSIALIWCVMTIIDIATLKEYKRAPFRLTMWILVFVVLIILDTGAYVIFLAGNVAPLVNLINLVPVAATIVASFYAQRFMAKLETNFPLGSDTGGENEF